jgi:hypothetical protein
MAMKKEERHTAAKQATGLGLVLVCVLGALVVVQRRPADAEELRIHVAELRSHVSELEWIASHGEDLPPRFAAAERARVLQKVDDTGEKLDALRLEQPGLATSRDEAGELLARSRTADAEELAGLRAQLLAMEGQLE